MFQKDFVAKYGGDLALFKSALFDWIEFCKQFLKAYKSTSIFDYSQLKESSEYQSLDEFYNDINKLTYSVTFTPVSEQYINEKNQAGELYLFEIHNKDWNAKDGQVKTGSKNTHTLYFESLFSGENEASGSVFKLNGQAEIFFRPATEEEKLGTKKLKSGNMVIDHKRYAKNTILFHLSITMNRGKKKITPFSFNEQTKEFLKQNKNINVIGIDRGEKHLAYYSVINQQCDILEIGSLNSPLGIPYQELLEKRARGREDARRDWNDVEKIKDLKKGYISQVVRKIADMIIQFNAIVVFEDLNKRFKQVRGGIEKSVYQQLEKALIDKLGFLIDKKEMDPQKAGHLLRAYQLTAPFETFKDMGKQTGIIFYTQAEYTSTTDPLTGFRKNIYVSNSAKAGKVLDMIAKFDVIGWDEENKSYYFTYNPIHFVEKKFSEKTLDKKWTVHAKVDRVAGQKNSAGKWESKILNPNELLQKLFEGWGLIESGQHLRDVKKAILENKDCLQGELRAILNKDKKRNFFSDFIYIFNLILQIRNSFSKKPITDKDGSVHYEGEDIDFIASPVYPFFTTKSSKSTASFSEFENKFIGNEDDKKKFLEEFNGDANGAYNIARKGIMILERLNNEVALKKDGLYIHKHQWDAFASNMYKNK
jgi:CRISPR-associated protein Cpf1